MRRQIVDRDVSAVVTSAGTTAEGYPAPEFAVDVMGRKGLDITEHRSRVLSCELIAGSDLVVAMAREHVRESVLLEQASYGRTFTLKELVRRGESMGGRMAGESLEAWLARMHQGRVATAHLGASAEDDIMDPIGMRKRVYERVADEISRLVESLAGLMWVDSPTTDQLESGAPL